MELATFNSFDGGAVVRDLRRNPRLWLSAQMDRFGAADRLTSLRDIPQGHWNADTLLLLADPAFKRSLEALARGWRPTELNWLPARSSAILLGVPGSTPLLVLRAWWD